MKTQQTNGYDPNFLEPEEDAGLDIQEKTAGSYKLIGYIFWINASWFLCGETAKLHLKVFEGSPAPTPFEIMVLLVLGWFFVLVGEYKDLRLKKS